MKAVRKVFPFNGFIPIELYLGSGEEMFGPKFAKIDTKITFFLQNGGSRSIICANYLLNRLGRYFQYLCFTVH